MNRVYLTLLALMWTACGVRAEQSVDDTSDVPNYDDCDESPMFSLTEGTYVATLDGGVPEAIREAYGDPAVGDVTLTVAQGVATLSYVTVDGGDVEVTMDVSSSSVVQASR